MEYNLVYLKSGILQSMIFESQEAFLAFFNEGELTPNGVTEGRMLREELRGLPRYNELAGPMYDGPGVVRYETWEAYEKLSM